MKQLYLDRLLLSIFISLILLSRKVKETGAKTQSSTMLLVLLTLGIIFGGCTLPTNQDDEDNSNENTLMFSEEFDSGFPNSQWNTTGPLANFIIDNNKGGNATPSLRVVAGNNVTATMFANGWTSETGLRLMVGVALPDDSTPENWGHRANAMIVHIIVHEGAGGMRAGLSFRRKESGASFGTLLDYYIYPNHVYEYLNWGAVTGQFMAFAFTVNPDGSSEWSRNGVRIFTNTSTDLSDKYLKVRLQSGPLSDVNFDDVQARVY